MTFEKAHQAISAIQMIYLNWTNIVRQYNVGISISVHKGNLHQFRSYVFGNDINVAMILSDLSIIYNADQDKRLVITSGKIKDEISGTEYERKFQELEAEKIEQENYREVIGKYRAFRFLIEDDQ